MANITLQTIESLPLVEEVNENTSLVGWDGEKTVRVAKDKLGTGLPSGGSPYMQLVTDGEGKAGWEDRLAYKTFEPATIAWDGNTDGLETFNNAYFKISNQTISKSQLLGQTVTFLNSGESLEIAIDETNTFEIYGGNVIIQFENGTGLVYSIKTPMEELTEGLWFFCISSDSRVSELTFISEIAHPIPAEYLPVSRIVFAYDGTNYTCNVPHSEFKNAISNGFPIIYVDKRESIPTLHSTVSVSGISGEYTDSGEDEWDIYIFSVMLFENFLTLKYTKNGIAENAVS